MTQAKAYGRADAPYLFVMVSPPSEGMLAWFWKQLQKAGILKTEVRLVFLIDEPPAGAGNKPLASQIRSARERFERDIRRSSPQVVVPMAVEPFRALTGINEGIFDVRGYLIRKDLFHPVVTPVFEQVGTYKAASKKSGAKKGDPKMKWVKRAMPTILGDFDGVVIPTFGLDHIRTEAFATSPAFIEDVKRARRAYKGDLREVMRDFKYSTRIPTLAEMKKLGEIIAVDIETHGVDNEVIDLVSFSDGDKTWVLEWSAHTCTAMTRIFALPGRLFAIHNSPFDIPRLVANGVKITQKVIDTCIFDTMYGAVNIQPDLHKALGRVASLYLDIPPWKTSSRKDTSHFRVMVKADPKGYAGKDSFATAWIAFSEVAVMKSLGIWKYFMGTDGHPGPGVMATIPELTRMSRDGIRVDRKRAEAWQHRLERRLLRYMKLWVRMFPSIDFGSNKQLQNLLYKVWGLPVERTREDGVTVDELALVKLQAYVRDNKDDLSQRGAWQQDPNCNPRTFDLMMKMRDANKMYATYVKPVVFGEEEWVHPSYLPASKDDERGGSKLDSKGNTSTGRLATYKPNLANQPKKARVLYVPDRDDMCFVQWDYKSAELYVLAGASGDMKLLSDLKGDMHQRNADRLGVSRKVAKNVTYASQYLAGPSKQSEMILKQEHIYVSPMECLAVSEGIWSYYTDATAYKKLLVSMCENKRYITNAFGRTRFFHAGRAPAAVDFIPQSTVADILWCVLKRVAEFLRSLGGRLVTTVYDSMLGCVPKDRVREAVDGVREIMETVFDCVRKGFYIPTECEVAQPGRSWGEVCCLEPKDDGRGTCKGCKQPLSLHFNMEAA